MGPFHFQRLTAKNLLAGHTASLPTPSGRLTKPSIIRPTFLGLRELDKPLQPRRMAQFAERLDFNLPNALPRHVELLPHLLEGPVDSISNPESHSHHLLLARGKGGEQFPDILGQVHLNRHVGGGSLTFVLDEVPEPRALVITDRHFEGNRLARNANELTNLVDGYLHLLCDFFRCGFAADSLRDIAAGANEFAD